MFKVCQVNLGPKFLREKKQRGQVLSMKVFLRFRFNDLNKGQCSYSWCVCGGEGRECAEQSKDEG